MNGDRRKIVSIMEELKAGDQSAWQKFYLQHSVRLVRVARRYGVTEDMANDLAQEALVYFATHIDEIQGTHPGTYLANKVRWLALDHLRLIKRLGEVTLDQMADRYDQNAQLEQSIEPRVEAIRAMLGSLSRNERLVLSLFYFNRCSYLRISEITGMNYDGVKNMLHRTKRRLKNRI
ncbi:sigma-70 family RNA polymerase sigma factor [Gammaproteobacteria bacterium]|nr:sigma-70 family RNA polymerase sigma factor [Gammaproteobacteria bacterium]